MKSSFFVLVLAYWLTSLTPIHATETPNLSHMQHDIQVLSHQNFGGRQTGTEGGLRSAEFVAARFEELGLLPAGSHVMAHPPKAWGQFSSVSTMQIQPSTLVEFSTRAANEETQNSVLHINSDYLPVLDSPSVNLTSGIVFVGYGISDPARGWDEYEGVNAHNRVVMFLRGKPSTYPPHIQHTDKEHMAREKGAAGFITLTGPVVSGYAARRGMGHQPLAFYTNAGDERPLPGVWISGEIGAQLFHTEGWDLHTIQETLNTGKMKQSRTLHALVHMKWESVQAVGPLINVLGMIPGNDPILQKETIILGAHRDHFGHQAGLLFPGADDNASGTAVLLETARVLKKGPPPKRTILFASFSGEEQNLLGSKFYVQHPTRPLNTTVAMINVDHVGIGDGQLTVGVSNMPKDVAHHAAETSGLLDNVKLYGFFPGGDHVPFAHAGTPTIAVVTAGKHPHFHQPTDTPDTIQPDRLQTAAKFVLALTQQLVNPD